MDIGIEAPAIQVERIGSPPQPNPETAPAPQEVPVEAPAKKERELVPA